MKRATTSLPVPDSPVSSTVVSVSATFAALARAPPSRRRRAPHHAADSPERVCSSSVRLAHALGQALRLLAGLGRRAAPPRRAAGGRGRGRRGRRAAASPPRRPPRKRSRLPASTDNEPEIAPTSRTGTLSTARTAEGREETRPGSRRVELAGPRRASARKSCSRRPSSRDDSSKDRGHDPGGARRSGPRCGTSGRLRAARSRSSRSWGSTTRGDRRDALEHVSDVEGIGQGEQQLVEGVHAPQAGDLEEGEPLVLEGRAQDGRDRLHEGLVLGRERARLVGCEPDRAHGLVLPARSGPAGSSALPARPLAGRGRTRRPARARNRRCAAPESDRGARPARGRGCGAARPSRRPGASPARARTTRSSGPSRRERPMRWKGSRALAETATRVKTSGSASVSAAVRAMAERTGAAVASVMPLRAPPPWSRATSAAGPSSRGRTESALQRAPSRPRTPPSSRPPRGSGRP